MTIASLEDLGYKVNLGAAEPYQLPGAAVVAAAGAVQLAGTETMMLRRIPIVLPDDHLA
jgi:hypothetical protein